MTRQQNKINLASSLGTIFEWYDFALYGMLAVIIGRQFFSVFDPSAQAIFALLAFAAGFLVRPFGAIVFGRLGDLVGRTLTFLITIVITGLSTFLVGLLLSHEATGWLAPVSLIALRMLQGLALGGEYGGAVVSVADHAPARPPRVLHGLHPDYGDAGPVAVACFQRDPARQHGRGSLHHELPAVLRSRGRLSRSVPRIRDVARRSNPARPRCERWPCRLVFYVPSDLARRRPTA